MHRPGIDVIPVAARGPVHVAVAAGPRCAYCIPKGVVVYCTSYGLAAVGYGSLVTLGVEERVFSVFA